LCLQCHGLAWVFRWASIPEAETPMGSCLLWKEGCGCSHPSLSSSGSAVVRASAWWLVPGELCCVRCWGPAHSVASEDKVRRLGRVAVSWLRSAPGCVAPSPVSGLGWALWNPEWPLSALLRYPGSGLSRWESCPLRSAWNAGGGMAPGQEITLGLMPALPC
jgi:hypothetical protein